MTNKNNLVFDVNECNTNMSSPTRNNEIVDSNAMQENPSSPEKATFLSDAFVAKLLSHTERPSHSPDKICNKKSLNTGQKSLVSALQNAPALHLEMKDTSTKCEDAPEMVESSSIQSLQMKSNNEQENQNNSSHLLLEDTNTKCENSSDLNGSSIIESLEVIEDKDVHKETNQGDVDMEKREETPSLSVMEAVETHNEKTMASYREEDSGTDDDSSSTFSLDSSSDCSDSFFQKMQNNVNSSISSRTTTTKTKGELDIDELPPIQDLQIHVNESEIEKVGYISSIVKKLVVVHSLKTVQPLDLDSVLFLTPDKPLGRIFDVLGPVSEPYYAVRFNSIEDIANSGIVEGSDVFYAPEKEEITSYVFVDELKKQRGSDASWKDNNEPPEECIDYSDDEQERAAKQKRRGKTRPKPFDDEEQSSKRDYPITTISDDPVTTASSTFNSFRSISSNTSNPSTSSHLSMATVMTSAYKPSAPWSPQRFQGPPIISPVQPANTFRGPSYAANINNHVPGPMRYFPPNTQPPEVKFCSPQSFISQPQQNLASAPPTSLPYPHPPSQPSFQFCQSPAPQPVRFQAFCPPQQVAQQPLQQPHVFGQVASFGPVSPALQQPALRFAPSVMSPPPFVSIPPASPNFSYFSHNYISAPSPPTHGHIAHSSPWFQGQAASAPRPMRFVAPMSPLSIQIPNNLRTPPPSMQVPTVRGLNGVSSIQSPQNVGPFIQHPGTGTYRY